MATYIISDIHGEYDLFIELLDKIKLKKEDTLYILGDVFDRGPHPIKTLQKLMEMPNAVCMMGNHELMALDCLGFLMEEITDMSIEELDEKMLDNLVTWQYNGSKTTIEEFRALSHEMQLEVIEFIKEFLIYEELTVNGKDFLLVHAGLGSYRPEKDIEDYSLKELSSYRNKIVNEFFRKMCYLYKYEILNGEVWKEVLKNTDRENVGLEFGLDKNETLGDILVKADGSSHYKCCRCEVEEDE